MATKTNQTQVDLYFHYQALLQKATQSQGLDELSPDHVALLVLIGRHWHEGEALSVRQLMQMREVASPATIHKRLHQLKDAELVSFEESDTDTRKRMITPTKRALSYFAAASKAMAQAVKAAQ